MISAALRNVYTPSRIVIMSSISLCFAVLVGFSALVKIPVPFTPVPITLQTFAVLAGAGILGRWYSIQMVFWYIALGVLGAPFFADGYGVQALMSPSAGYIFGFILASAMLGFSEKRNALAFIFATLAIYLPGVLWLKISTSADWINVFKMGVLPFIIFDIVKAMTAYSSVRCLKYSLSKKD